MNPTVISYDKQVYSTKLPEGNFWDHSDGGYQRKILPGLIIWQWKHTGKITLKCNIDEDLANNHQYTHIGLILRTQGKDGPIRFESIGSSPRTIELDPNKKHRLTVISTRKNEETGERIDENWIVEFSPIE